MSDEKKKSGSEEQTPELQTTNPHVEAARVLYEAAERLDIPVTITEPEQATSPSFDLSGSMSNSAPDTPLTAEQQAQYDAFRAEHAPRIAEVTEALREAAAERAPRFPQGQEADGAAFNAAEDERATQALVEADLRSGRFGTVDLPPPDSQTQRILKERAAAAEKDKDGHER